MGRRTGNRSDKTCTGADSKAERCSGFSPTGCAGLAAIRTVFLLVRHQRCWVHKMCNPREARRCDCDQVKPGAQAIDLAETRAQAEAHFAASVTAGVAVILTS
jgi:transposase-like protein